MNYIIANWKCNPGSKAAVKKILTAYLKKIENSKKNQVIVCPPACYLPLALEVLKTKFSLGGQNFYQQDGGAFTGENSAAQLADLKCKYVIVGHSERRKLFKETISDTNRKLKAALAAGLIPVLCVGETREERISGHITEIIESQVRGALQDIGLEAAKQIIIAYEPVWAIGTGQACNTSEANVIRQYIYNMRGEGTIILYGGSVNAQNAMSYLKEAGFNGLLVGGASLDAAEFAQLVLT